jgi:hypothetical protein
MKNLRLPIFQMTWGEKDGKFGLMYPSELDYDSQDFTFVIPVPVGYINSRPRFDRLQSQLLKTEFYFPIEVAGEYVEVTGTVKIQEDLFEPDSENSITFITPKGLTAEFIIDLFMLKSIYRVKGINRLRMSQYIGKYKKPVFEECLFIPIIIRNASILNDFYLKNKGIFVGYTKDFGLFDDDNNSQNSR